jgi:glucosamine--fructose-6-phosphate aminotransferase (isomerizing)
MCGIVGVVRRRAERPAPDPVVLARDLDEALARLERVETNALLECAHLVAGVDAELRGIPGLVAILADDGLAATLASRLHAIEHELDRIEADLDRYADVEGLEAFNAALVAARDAVWAVRHDRLGAAVAVASLAGSEPSVATLEASHSIQVALSALDRLEVRGRDSAGLHVMVRGHGLDLDAPEVDALVGARTGDRLFGSRSVRVVGPDRNLSFVYKAAAEIGELGDNTAILRDAIRDDALLRLAVRAETAEAVVLGHTRWASVGIISEANAHPLNQEEVGRADGPAVIAALNGDVDNYVDVKALEQLEFPREITTDAKVIPALVGRRLDAGAGLAEAFRTTVGELEGSLAIGAQAASEPARLLLSLRGSGQALYVGIAEDAFVVASEPYGLVEETARYLRMDGETPADPARPSATRGQIVVLDAAAAGTLDGITRFAFDGTPLPIADAEIKVAEITTRDIDRGEFPHFLLKEMSEAPASFRKTLRGKIVDRDGHLHVEVGDDALPIDVRERLRSGSIQRVIAIGQGTAAVAAQNLALFLAHRAGSVLRANAIPAAELSGFELDDDMSDTIVVAISQSGTTTDTNRTVDLAKARGATVLAIVNRRNSDLVDRAHGVLFTADGRDVEMAVPSTKAFYSQIAAGFLLGLALATEVTDLDPARTDALLRGLRALPAAMEEVLAERDAIGAIALRHAPSRRYWAIVGNGSNRIAAQEIRIKLSELCYKSISFDTTEDKKHIDLSAEPLVLVCAAGLTGSNADDVAKEIEIYRAHRAAPIVIMSAGEQRFGAALETIPVPTVHPDLDFVLAAMAGHLFGYEAALAIDASARPLHEARGAVRVAISTPGGDAGDLLERLRREVERPAAVFVDGLRAGNYDGHLEASTATRIASLLRYATGVVPLDVYQVEHGKVGTPGVVVDDLTAALTKGIEELTRPIDAIKHQAKTVTVGISRSDDELLRVPLVREVLTAGAPRDSLSYRSLRTLAALDPAVAKVTGFTRYRVEGDVATDSATVHIVDRGGVSLSLQSRTDTDPRLEGHKHRVATQREVTAVRGRRDHRTLVIVPEVKDNQTVGLTLLHVDFALRLTADDARAVLQGYQGRYGALRDAVTETVPEFDDAQLARIDLVELLTEPVYVLADRWHTTPGG